jgi:aspartate racemase
MTIVGLVGGLGPESTIDYYRRILALWSSETPDSAPSVIIDSVDVQHTMHLVATDRVALVDYLTEPLDRLANAGVDFAAITANTPHIVFDDLAPRARVPLVSIVEVCARAAQGRGLKRVLLLGTRFTMENDFYPKVCSRYGVVVVVPDGPDREWVHLRYVGELLKGVFLDSTRAEVVALAERLRDEKKVDGIILGGTELPLLLSSPAIAGLPVLDTTALHVAAIVENLRQPSRRK